MTIQNAYSDPNRQIQLGQCDILADTPPPIQVFETREPLLKEVQEIMRKARSSSAPGPSRVPYKVQVEQSHLEEREGGAAVEMC